MKISRLEKEAGRILFFEDFQESLQEEIRESWNNIFNLSDKTKSIQAVFWSLRKEQIISAYKLEFDGEILQYHRIKKKSLRRGTIGVKSFGLFFYLTPLISSVFPRESCS